ncbi:MAG TPA: aminotransferase class III-fold pyridoxal phosphate-dependent enzyme, partial [Polyangiales bacterium]
GLLHSLPTPIEIDAARDVVDAIPGADMVRFFKTGADATSAAVRLARHLTGRERIVTVGYNGWHDHFMFDTKGVPAHFRDYTLRMPLMREEDEPALLALLDARGSELALVLLSLPYNRCVSREFLLRLRERCRAQGVLLVFDEVVTGFRLALGGAQEFYGVEADIVCLSKGIAAGMPLSALAGPRASMAPLADLQVSTTFGGELLSLAACRAAISVYRSTDYFARLSELGALLAEGVNRFARDRGHALRILGYAPIPLFRFSEDMAQQARAAEVFLAAMARRGVLLRRDVNFISGVHTKEQVEFTIEACRSALTEIGAS